jgi:fluoride exporter
MIGNFLLVALGGAAGAAARYGVGLALGPPWGLPWGALPWATLMVNIVGGFAMGALIGGAWGGDKSLTLLLGTGFLGGFTTFSAFSAETVAMIEAGGFLLACLYAAMSVGLCVLACASGLALARCMS